MELTWNGSEPLTVGDQTRGFLEDGDRVEITGHCAGARRIGFGSVSGEILPAVRFP